MHSAPLLPWSHSNSSFSLDAGCDTSSDWETSEELAVKGRWQQAQLIDKQLCILASTAELTWRIEVELTRLRTKLMAVEYLKMQQQVLLDGGTC